jgi:hypothetical protein
LILGRRWVFAFILIATSRAPSTGRALANNRFVFHSVTESLGGFRLSTADKSLLLGDLLRHVDRDIAKALKLARETTTIDKPA